jgi:colanic acid/amylovoran biosynthesis protein
MSKKDKNDTMKICLLGPSFGTGNLGVNALTESSIKAIISRWPNAEVTLLGSGWVDTEYQIKILGQKVSMRSLPIRFCKNVFLPNHFIVLLLYALLLRLCPSQRFRKKISKCNRYVRTIVEADMVADITGGDSFSDIYGTRRFILGSMRKWLIMFFRKKLVFLPQTYGPFKKRVTKIMARHILNYADIVYSRDADGLHYVRKLLRDGNTSEKIRLLSDVAFILDPRRPKDKNIESLEKIKAENRILVGLNISGLLSLDNHVGKKKFNIKADYFDLINSVLELLMRCGKTAVLLVPHTVETSKSGDPREKDVSWKVFEQSDESVCRKIYEQSVEKYNNRLFLAQGPYDHNETKYIIGLCEFFIGSRMHACIAALSQSIPAVGLAYSKKFRGVFESVGAEEMVVDMRHHEKNEILEAIRTAFEKREVMAEHLRKAIPDVQAKILSMFSDLDEINIKQL